MTESHPVFHRREGEGWLVLAGSIPELGGRSGTLMERLLALLDLSRPIVAIAAPDADPGEVQEFLEGLEDWLGTEAGVLELDTDLDIAGWEDSGLLFLFGDDGEAWIGELQDVAGDRLARAFERGAIVLAAGGAASIFAALWISSVRPDSLSEGLGWLPGSMILTDPSEAQDPLFRDWLQGPDPRTGILLGAGSILALGPDGLVEIWSEAAPEVLLGRGWAAS